MHFTKRFDRAGLTAALAFGVGLTSWAGAAQAAVTIPTQAPSTSVTTTTLLTDSESNGTNFPWSAQPFDAGSGTVGTATATWDGSVGHNALGSAKLIMGTPGVNFIFSPPSGVSLSANTRYAVNVWIKSNTNNASLDFIIRGGGPGYYAYASRHVVATTSWQLVSIQGLPGESGTAIMAASATPGSTFWLDDLVISKITKNEYAPANTTSAIPSTMFGLHMNKIGTVNLPIWPAEGQNILRMHDTGTDWCDIETSPGTYDTSRLDFVVNYITGGFSQTGNTQGGIIYTMGQTPALPGYSSMPNLTGSAYCTHTSEAAPPADMSKWDNYVTFIGNHLKGKVKYYEIWNEWDIPSNYTSTTPAAGVAALVTMTQHARTILKKIDPNIVILSPAITARNGALALEQFLAAGGGAYVDAISFHGSMAGTPIQLIGQIENIRAIMANHNLASLPIADTEGGVGCDPKTSNPVDCPVSPTTVQIDAFPLLNQLVLWTHGVVNFNYYTWEGNEGDQTELVYGLDPLNMPGPSTCAPYTCQTPLGTIYAQAVGWLKGATVTDGYQIPGAVGGESIYVFKLKDSSNRFEVVIWADGAGESVQLSSTWKSLIKSTVLNGSNTQTAIPSTRLIPISNTPLLLTSF